jgi:hypothetical protein
MQMRVLAIIAGFLFATGTGARAESKCIECQKVCQAKLNACVAKKKPDCGKKGAACLQKCQLSSGCP